MPRSKKKRDKNAKSYSRRVGRKTRLILSHQVILPSLLDKSKIRKTLGVGEYVDLSANQKVQWSIPGDHVDGFKKQVLAVFKRPGNNTVFVKSKTGDDTTLTFNVVAPSIRTHKITDIQITNKMGVGVGMKLGLTLTPLNVSFGSIQVREEDNSADKKWGYFVGNKFSFRHYADKNWNYVSNFNLVQKADLAAWIIIPKGRGIYKPPYKPGGFRWLIPASYSFDRGGNAFSFNKKMPQTFQWLPVTDRPPFAGRITLWKGGQVVSRTYPKKKRSKGSN